MAISGTLNLPGDKSISHRASLLNSIATGTAHVSNFCVGDDRSSMLRCLRGLGADLIRHVDCAVRNSDECFKITGKGLYGLTEPGNVLNAGHRATTMRLVSGLLAPQSFLSVITVDTSIRSRPLDGILTPIEKMGARPQG